MVDISFLGIEYEPQIVSIKTKRTTEVKIRFEIVFENIKLRDFKAKIDVNKLFFQRQMIEKFDKI